MGKLILLVDGSATIQQLVRLALADEDIEVIAASTAAEARRCVQSRSPDLILADLSLPDGDGLVLVRELRSKPQTARTPVIILAPVGMDRDVARMAAADAVLTKPFESIALLVRTVRELSSGPSPLELPSTFDVSPVRVLDTEGDSILELDEPSTPASAETGSISHDQMVSSMVPLLAELVADRVVEEVRERLSRDVIERAVPEVVRTVVEMLANAEPAKPKTPTEAP